MTEPRESPLRVLVTDQGEHREIVCGYLERAKEQGMLDVLIVGSLPGGAYYMAWTPSMNRTEMIGYLEQAKHRILADIVARED